MRAAMRFISECSCGSPLNFDSCTGPNPTDKIVREILSKKHPPAQPPRQSFLVSSDAPTIELHPILFEKIDGPTIRSTALQTDGAAGPSGLDAAAWKRMSTSFKSIYVDLCDAVAAIGRRICSRFVDPKGLSALVACRLIALDKCPGIRPIGIGETVHRIIGKTISAVVREDIQDSTGPLQVCAGHLSGCEAAVHSMRQVFEALNTHAVILVDASNAQSSRNIHNLCPALSKVLVNTYREDIQLFIKGEVILSQEGTTQGDPLAMAMYTITITPLINRLESTGIKQVWYADDATAGGDLTCWWDRISEMGPEYGYYPNASNTWIIIKEANFEEATTLFQGTGVSITVEGKRHLGAAIGDSTFVESYIQLKVAEWVKEIERLSSIATTQPHAAYAAFTHGLTSRWNYLSRTIPDIGELLQPLEIAIRHKFLPSLTGQNAFTDADRNLMALPVRLGGLGIINPCLNSAPSNKMSQEITAPLVTLIMEQSHTYTAEAKAEQLRRRRNVHTVCRQREAIAASELKEQLPSNMQRAMLASAEKGASSWLTTLPIDEHGFSLHKGAFKDALCLRYSWRPSHHPSHCVCGKQFSVDHAMNCHRGGLPSIRHDEIRNITADLLSEVCHCVGVEPTLQPVTDERLTHVHRTSNREDGPRLDIVTKSFWGGGIGNAHFST